MIYDIYAGRCHCLSFSHLIDCDQFLVTTLLKVHGDVAKNTKYNGRKKNEIVNIKSYKIVLIQPTEWKTKSLNREDVLLELRRQSFLIRRYASCNNAHKR